MTETSATRPATGQAPEPLPAAPPGGSGDGIRFVIGLAIPVAAIMLLGWLAPTLGSEGLYGGIDGQWAAHNARALLEWGNPFDLSPFSPFNGLGGMFLPNLPWLNPAAIALALPDRELAYLVSYIVYLAILTGSIFFLARTIGLSDTAALLAALLHVFFLFPPFDGTFQVPNWYTLAPVYAQLGALLNVGVALYLRLDAARGVRGNLLCLAGILAAAIAAFVTAPMPLLMFLPFYGLLAAVLTLADLRRDDWRRTLAWRLGAAAAVLALIWASGVADYYTGTAAASARMGEVRPGEDLFTWLGRSYTAALDVFDRQGFCLRRGETICTSSNLILFQLLALAGALLWLLRGGRRLRPLGLFYLLFVAAGLVHAALWLGGRLGSLSVVSPGFLSWSSYSLAAILAAGLLCCLGGALLAALRRRAPAPLGWRAPASRTLGWRALALGVVAATAALGALHLFVTPQIHDSLPARVDALLAGQPVADRAGSNPVIAALQDEVGLHPGGVFRGRVASFMGGEEHVQLDPEGKAQAVWQSPGWLSRVVAHRWAAGNRHWGTDLWEQRIPTLGDYGQWITPIVRAFVNRLLHTEASMQGPNYLVASRVRPRILRLLGVSVVLSDLPVPALQGDAFASVLGGEGATIHAYRLGGANLGDYSPTSVRAVASLEEMAARIDEAAVDLRQQVFVLEGHQPPAQPWAGAQAAQLRFVRDGFRVTASADGPALLLLPVLYSSCWQVQPGGSPQPPSWVGRGDALLVLLAFDRALDVSFGFDFGLGNAADCRHRDGAEMAAWLRR